MVARTHVQAIAATDGRLRLRGVLARDVERATSFAANVATELGETPKVYSSVEALADDASVDFVILATPPNARREICQCLVAAGKPVLMEKPVERNLTAAQSIVTLFEAAHVPLGIVFQHRARESAHYLEKLLEGGALGALAVVDITVPWWREQAYYEEPGRGTYQRDGGGVLISQAIHTLDLALHLLGPVARVQAIARSTSLHSLEAEDYVSAGLDFSNGAVGSLLASTASYPGSAESIVLQCEHAAVTLQSGALSIQWRDGRTESIGTASATGGGADPMAFTHAWHQQVIENFAAVVETGSSPLASGRDALKVHQLIDALIASSRQQRAIDVFSLPTDRSSTLEITD